MEKVIKQGGTKVERIQIAPARGTKVVSNLSRANIITVNRLSLGHDLIDETLYKIKLSVDPICTMNAAEHFQRAIFDWPAAYGCFRFGINRKIGRVKWNNRSAIVTY